ncbi:MAG: dTDP-4-dehydrorhamnose 3,5-epimerase family protein [Pseudonocardiaceae bacterium]
MQTRALAVDGAFEFTPTVFPDDRGLFVSPFQETAFVDVVGHRFFPVAQTNHSRSRRGVVRGVHFTLVPPGTAKYVYCARGKTLDMVVDVRVGSPTFGCCEAVLMDQVSFRAMYLPVGVGHAFVALEDDTVMSYLLSDSYVAEKEMSVSALSPALGLPIPADVEPIQSERDIKAPTLEEAMTAGLLPDYALCRRLEEALWSA